MRCERQAAYQVAPPDAWLVNDPVRPFQPDPLQPFRRARTVPVDEVEARAHPHELGPGQPRAQCRDEVHLAGERQAHVHDVRGVGDDRVRKIFDLWGEG
jgi:hypothetical protein